MLEQETLEVKEGALVIVSSTPMGCSDLQRNFKQDTVWTPQLLVALPPEGNPFIINPGGISLKNTPSYIETLPSGAHVWYADENIMKSIKLRGYYFIPGQLKEELTEFKIHTIQGGFYPDLKDPDRSRLDINILSQNGSFSYSDRGTLKIHSRKSDLPNLIYTIMHSPAISHFGYDCYHSGEFGLPHNLDGELKATQDQRRQAALAITRDLEKSLSLNLLD